MTIDRHSVGRAARAARRGLVLGFAVVGAMLRHLPGAGLVKRFASLTVTLLVIGALVSLVAWGSQKSPQRISLAELAIGALPPMQTWIIVSGEVRLRQHADTGYSYVLTDPATPNASIMISSDAELSEGETTVSGILLGGDARAPEGFAWVGHLDADPVLASEQSPPWIAMTFALGGVLVGLLASTSYPVFFIDEARPSAARTTRFAVGVWPDCPPIGASTPGTLELEPSAPARLRQGSGEARLLRVHSAKSSFEVARLQWLTGSEPLLVIRAAGGDVTLSFASGGDRDGAYGALVASAAAWPRRVA